MQNSARTAFLPLIILGILFSVSGCGSGKMNQITEDNTITVEGFTSIKQMADWGDAHIKIGETTCPAGIKEAKFDPDKKNVEKFPGAQGAEYFLGTKNFQLPQNPEEIKKFTHTFATYMTYKFPWQGTHTEKKFLYPQEQTETTKGPDGYYVITCDQGIVVFHGEGGKRDVDKVRVENIPGGNLLAPAIAILGVVGIKVLGLF